MDLTEEFWKPKELADQLRKLGLASSSRTLARWQLRHQGPPITRIGGRKLYRRASVLAWIRAREQRPARATGKRA
jgi:hypothetical protein